MKITLTIEHKGGKRDIYIITGPKEDRAVQMQFITEKVLEDESQ